MTRIRNDAHLEFSDVALGGAVNAQVVDVEYPLGRKMSVVNVYDQLRQKNRQ